MPPSLHPVAGIVSVFSLQIMPQPATVFLQWYRALQPGWSLLPLYIEYDDIIYVPPHPCAATCIVALLYTIDFRMSLSPNQSHDAKSAGGVLCVTYWPPSIHQTDIVWRTTTELAIPPGVLEDAAKARFSVHQEVSISLVFMVLHPFLSCVLPCTCSISHFHFGAVLVIEMYYCRV